MSFNVFGFCCYCFWVSHIQLFSRFTPGSAQRSFLANSRDTVGCHGLKLDQPLPGKHPICSITPSSRHAFVSLLYSGCCGFFFF